MAILEVNNLTLKFGGVTAVDNLSFEVAESSITSLIGPNGAGKTSAFNCLTGLYIATSGEIKFGGTSVLKLKPHAITEMGMARTFQNLRLFKNMSVLENVMSGMHCRGKAGVGAAVFRPASQQAEEKHIVEFSEECLDFGRHSGQKKIAAPKICLMATNAGVEWARALATQPKLLLLDEPAAGLNHDEKMQLIELNRKIRDERGITVFLIEHDMSLIMKISEKIVVIDYGKKIAEGLRCRHPGQSQSDRSLSGKGGGLSDE